MIDCNWILYFKCSSQSSGLGYFTSACTKVQLQPTEKNVGPINNNDKNNPWFNFYTFIKIKDNER